MNKYAQNWKNEMLEELHGWEKKHPADVGVMVIAVLNAIRCLSVKQFKES